MELELVDCWPVIDTSEDSLVWIRRVVNTNISQIVSDIIAWNYRNNGDVSNF